MSSSNTRRKPEQNLYLIPQTQTYKSSHEPLLSQQKTASIQQKLKLQKQAIQQTRERETNLDFYIKYNYNPFLEYRGQDSAYVKEMLMNRKEDVVNIADKLAEMGGKQGVVIKGGIQVKSGFMKDMKDNFELFSNKILNNIQKERVANTHDNANITTTPTQDKDNKSPISMFNHFKNQQKQPQSATIEQQQIIPKQPTEKHLAKYDIESIAVIKQQNFFLKNYKKPNIFRIARGEDEELSSRELLRKFHFCNNGVVEKISKVKLPIYRDISTLSRKVIMGQQTGNENMIDYADSYQLSFKLKELLFHDIMSVASNRFNPDFLNRRLNFQDSGGNTNKQMSDTSSQQVSDINIIYRNNQVSQQHIFINQNEQQQQIKDYKLLTNNEAQQKLQKKYNKQREFIQNKLELRKHLTGNTVKDMGLHQEIDEEMKNAFRKFVRLDQSKMDSDRLVRYNKVMKNKTEGNKMKILLETIAYKNKQDELIANANKAKGNR